MDQRQTLEPPNKEENRPTISCPPRLSQPYPWLVIYDEADDSHQTFYSISRNQYFVCSIPEMQNKFIKSSQQGWLFLEDNTEDDFSLFNIFTFEKIQLPPPSFENPYYSVLSSCTKKLETGCRILVMSGYMFKFRSCHLGDDVFVEGDVYFEGERCCLGAVLNYEGKLYALAVDTIDLLIADFADPELQFTPIIRGHKSLPQMLRLTDDVKYYLIESSGEVLFVYTNCLYYDGLDIKIYKADFARKEWVEVKCLDGRALFLDPNKGLSSSPEASEFGLKCNCVYYVNSSDRNLYGYDLKDRCITRSLPYPIVSNENSDLYWAM